MYKSFMVTYVLELGLLYLAKAKLFFFLFFEKTFFVTFFNILEYKLIRNVLN